MDNIYFISGLGADERVFQFLDIKIQANIFFIKWIDPLKNENLQNYVKRLSRQIDSSDNNILIAVSFGGIIAIELSKIVNLKKIFIISSIKTKNEMPILYRIIKVIKIVSLIPSKLFISCNSLISFFFGIENKKEKELLTQILQDTNASFAKWAIMQFLNWETDIEIKNLIHIHGTKDRLLPIRNIKHCNRIVDGTHFMIINKSEEISNIINEHLKNGI